MVNGFMPIHDEEKDWVVATNMTLGEQAFRYSVSILPFSYPHFFQYSTIELAKWIWRWSTIRMFRNTFSTYIPNE